MACRQGFDVIHCGTVHDSYFVPADRGYAIAGPAGNSHLKELPFESLDLGFEFRWQGN
jgi:hypothetical protein